MKGVLINWQPTCKKTAILATEDIIRMALISSRLTHFLMPTVTPQQISFVIVQIQMKTHLVYKANKVT